VSALKPGLHQQTGMRQELRMNPRLYQAMDLLYMPLLDLQQHLKQELLANPFLDLLEPEDSNEVTASDVVEEQPAEKEKEGDDEPDWESLLLDDGGSSAVAPRDYTEAPDYEPVSADSRDLRDHLRDQLNLLNLSPREMLLAEEFLGNLAEDGYLGASFDEIVAGANRLLEQYAAEAGGDDPPAVSPYPTADAEAMLVVIQGLDPAGVGARDLRETLLLQLAEQDRTDSVVYRLVRDAFDDLIAHRWSDLGKKLAIEPAQVQQAADELAKLDPKPGLRYSGDRESYIIPDLVVEKVDDRYLVFLNDGGLPRLRISRTYRDLARDRKKFDAESKEFISQRLNSAQWMIQAIEQRRQTMLKVMNFIVDRQRDFFDKGVEHLRPLTLREVADVINMHESTVSRVTNAKYVQTPRGLLPLKFFFSSGLQTTTGEDASARSIKAQMRKLVEDENVNRPLTDQQIVDHFMTKGVRIARRTVAKYRDQLGLLPARMRKRL
jgi:RNA polymerase sigma-54 factor